MLSLPPNKNYSEAIAEHIRFLQSQGLDVDPLSFQIDTPQKVRCSPIGDVSVGRGDLCYQTRSSVQVAKEESIGIITWCWGNNGVAEYTTYGAQKREGEQLPIIEKAKAHIPQKNPLEFIGRHETGEIGYRLEIPMYDENMQIMGVQFVHSDGSTKVYPKGTSTKYLFFHLEPLHNGETIGITRSYFSAATCRELTDIRMVCVFECENFEKVVALLRANYPDSRIILFADSDRHLPQEERSETLAQKICKTVENCQFAVPTFADSSPNWRASTWDDLVIIEGRDVAFNQLCNLNIIRG